MTHELKTLTQYFNEVRNGNKTFEVRFNDRNFQVGDILILKNYDGEKYLGDEIKVKVSYILDNSDFCKDGYVVLGIKPVKEIKTYAICGSMKFAKEQQKVAEDLELKGNCVIQCIYGERKYNQEQCDLFDKIHKHKIDIADGIFVVNVGGYMGEQTKREIEYAKEHGKEILYYEDINGGAK